MWTRLQDGLNAFRHQCREPALPHTHKVIMVSLYKVTVFFLELYLFYIMCHRIKLQYFMIQTLFPRAEVVSPTRLFQSIYYLAGCFKSYYTDIWSNIFGQSWFEWAGCQQHMIIQNPWTVIVPRCLTRRACLWNCGRQHPATASNKTVEAENDSHKLSCLQPTAAKLKPYSLTMCTVVRKRSFVDFFCFLWKIFHCIFTQIQINQLSNILYYEAVVEMCRLQ